MVKSKFLSNQQYITKLSEIVQETEAAGERVAPFFEKLAQAIADDAVAAMPSAEFKEIAVEFDDVVEVYQVATKKLSALKAPARMIGGHTVLNKTFAQYTDATEVMAQALDVSGQKIDMVAFNQSEEDQDALMTKFYSQVQRLMSTGV
ncbi:hypothetical protein ESZ50_10735 [Weissella muntiaci]|uniref:Chemotaxis protein n=1 Tax=Weissella muntiaci TaxID=2508881 RepID=A0A6C2C3S1_9LACO|nr:hypothetical protein [Weissella muntiaci]TYC47895.1 hypothetical protein ESZ50_10735 [Weissella muntiaci]